MGLFKAIENLFSYQEPPKLEGERLRRYELMGKSNRELNIILDRYPPLHVKKTTLVDLIIEKEQDQ